MLSHVGRRYRGATGNRGLSFLSPEIVDFPSQGFLESASDDALISYAVALREDELVLSGKIAALQNALLARSKPPAELAKP